MSERESDGRCVEVWFVETAKVDEARLRSWFDWLADDEKAKHARFVTKELRREYLVTRALSRWALSRWIPSVAPSDWRFERTEAGKPFVVSPRIDGDDGRVRLPRFSLANAGGLVVCAMGAPGLRGLGVDVETKSRGGELAATAARFFSPRELDALRVLDEAGQRRRTVELWTLKEAYLKARGGGISVHLNRFGVEKTRRGTVEQYGLDVDALDGDPADWQLLTHDIENDVEGPDDGFIVAVAIHAQNPAVPAAYEVTYKAMD